MRIGALVGAANVSRDTVRFYECQGLLTGVSRGEATNNYKDYPEENVKRIEIIRYLQRFGFTLRECRDLLVARDALSEGCIDRRSVFAGKLTQIDHQIAELQVLRERIAGMVANEDFSRGGPAQA